MVTFPGVSRVVNLAKTGAAQSGIIKGLRAATSLLEVDAISNPFIPGSETIETSTLATKNSKPTDTLPAALEAKRQAETFDQAMGLFHKREFRRAMPLFSAVAEGPVRDMAHSARTHLRMCDSRLAKTEPEARTAEENYAHAVAQMNLRAYADAAALLDVSLRQQETDYAHYAAASARGHLGQLDMALGHLKRAIQMHPRNRAMAKGDPDFAELAKFPPIRDLLMGS